MVDQEIAGETRRHIALTLAVKLTAEQQVQKYDGDLTVNVAKVFEKYLAGKGDE